MGLSYVFFHTQIGLFCVPFSFYGSFIRVLFHWHYTGLVLFYRALLQKRPIIATHCNTVFYTSLVPLTLQATYPPYISTFHIRKSYISTKRALRIHKKSHLYHQRALRIHMSNKSTQESPTYPQRKPYIYTKRSLRIHKESHTYPHTPHMHPIHPHTPHIHIRESYISTKRALRIHKESHTYQHTPHRSSFECHSLFMGLLYVFRYT